LFPRRISIAQLHDEHLALLSPGNAVVGLYQPGGDWYPVSYPPSPARPHACTENFYVLSSSRLIGRLEPKIIFSSYENMRR
jgi:hypothetical protein